MKSPAQLLDFVKLNFLEPGEFSPSRMVATLNIRVSSGPNGTGGSQEVTLWYTAPLIILDPGPETGWRLSSPRGRPPKSVDLGPRDQDNLVYK